MKLIEQSHEILHITPNLLKFIERAGRTCYKSEHKITEVSAEQFVRNLIKSGHHAMIEFGDIIVKFITNRGVTHELVRHRLFSFAQESTRYCNYGGKDIEFIKPVWYNEDEDKDTFRYSLWDAEDYYNDLLDSGWRPEQAREVLPNALKTEIVVKGNIREWRHAFKLRTDKAAHPQIRALMQNCLNDLKTKVPVVFDDI